MNVPSACSLRSQGTQLFLQWVSISRRMPLVPPLLRSPTRSDVGCLPSRSLPPGMLLLTSGQSASRTVLCSLTLEQMLTEIEGWTRPLCV